MNSVLDKAGFEKGHKGPSVLESKGLFFSFKCDFVTSPIKKCGLFLHPLS